MSRSVKVSVVVIAVVMGFLLTQQIRTVAFINHTAQIQEAITLSHLVTSADEANLLSRQKVLAMQARLATASSNTPALSPIRAALTRTQSLAGLTAQSGSGVQVIIHDATQPAFPGEPAILELVHDQYVLQVVSLLSAAGASAIAIDGQRYTATTAIFCAGPTIRINGVPYASPYVVDAVGPSGAMLTALQDNPDIEGWSQLVSIKFHPDSHLEIAAYRGAVHFSSIKPVNIER